MSAAAAPGVAVDAEGQLYTRGGPNVPDNRGQSMVEKHLEKIQKEKEAKGLEKLQSLLPNLGAAVLSLALAECQYDPERAVVLLRRFQVAKHKEVHALEKERKKYELEKERAKRQQEEKRGRRGGSGSSGSDSDSASSSGSDSSSSESESEEERQRRRRKDKKRRRSDSRSRSPKRSKKRSSKGRKEKEQKEKERRKKRKEREKEKEKKAKAKGGAAVRQEDFGKYGILRETDLHSKRPEFMLWAMEVKKQDPELMPKFEEKELFKEFMEEYNTATLPHKKYYDIDTYERRKAIKAAKKGLPAGPVERTAFDDEAELKRERAAQRAKDQQERLQQAYDELLHTDKARDMREQELLRMKMGLAYRTGDVEEARKIAEKLKPDDPADLARQR